LCEIVESRDLNGLITEKLPKWSGSGGFRATMKSRNASARAFECFLCRRHFELRISLNKHIQLHSSSKNLNKRYGKTFKFLAAKVSRWESGSYGFMNFETV
ncbi:hypothetical protein F5883DRAFT_410044, partial [Diaporthe sp. PMI_573]